MNFYSTADQARAYERNVSRGRGYEAEDRMQDIYDVLVIGVAYYRALYEVVGRDDRITEGLQCLRDMASDVRGECRPLIEEAGLLFDCPENDFSELDALLAKVECP